MGYVVFIALAMTACGGGGGGIQHEVVTLDGLTVPITDAPQGPYSLVGSVLNLGNSGLRLNDGFDVIDVAAGATSFVFRTKLPAGSDYDVTIVQQPEGQVCAVSYGQGRIQGTERKVIVNCASPPQFAFLLMVNDIVQYAYDQDSGELTEGYTTRWTDGASSTAYYTLTKHPIQSYVFAFHAYEHKLVALYVDKGTGQVEKTGEAFVPYEDGNAFRVRITPDGKYIYVGGLQNGVYGFEFHEDSGTMTPIDNGNVVVHPNGAGDYVPLDDFEMDPQGKYVYGSNKDTGVNTLRIEADGTLNWIARYKGTQGVGMMSIHPDGKRIFASSADSSGLQVIDVNDGVLGKHVDLNLNIHKDFWTGIQVDPTGTNVFLNSDISGRMGAYPVSSLMNGSLMGSIESIAGGNGRSLFSISQNGKFVYDQRHDPEGLDGFRVDLMGAPPSVTQIELPDKTKQSRAFLVY